MEGVLDNISNLNNSFFIKSKGLRFLIKLLFCISGTATVAVVSLRSIQVLLWVISTICCFVLLTFLTFKFELLEKAFLTVKKNTIIIALLLSVAAVYEYSQDLSVKISKGIERFPSILPFSAETMELLSGIALCLMGCLMLISVFVFMYAFVRIFFSKFKDWFCDIDNVEKKYLIICAITFAVAVIVIFSITNVFYGAVYNGEIIYYDTIFSSDSTQLVEYNSYLNFAEAENDLRQPLFGVFAAPFAAFARLISMILFFVPNAFPIALNIIQVLLLLISAIMLSRLMNIGKVSKGLFLTLFTVTYPTLLYSLNMEQYIFSLFWLIAFVYAYMNKKKNMDWHFVAAAGSMLTSGLLFPLLGSKKDIKSFIKTLFYTFIKFMIVVILFGKTSIFIRVGKYINSYLGFAGAGITFYEKLLQFMNFVAMCFVAPKTFVEFVSGNPAYRTYAVETINYFGVIMLILSVIGFLLNYKNTYAKICFGWVVSSFLLLCLIGWGTAENGLVLYLLYYSWAYISLIFMMVEKVLAKAKKLRYCVYGIAIVTLMAFNLPAIYDVISFGIRYYGLR